MSYAVETTGTLVLPEALERQALTVLEVELAGRQGAFDDSQHVDDLASLARFAGAEVRRDGDRIDLSPTTATSPQWSDQSTAFYVGLARWVKEGEVHLVGQDGARWSYRYGPDGVIQVGQNGWDGSLVPFGEPMAHPTAAPAGQPFGQAGGTAVEPAGGRGFAMTMLFLFGVVMIVAVAMLAAGLFD
jgi:hypothetical protein